MRWSLQSMSLDGFGSPNRGAQEARMMETLADGWEPFAVVPCGGQTREVWFRRMETVQPDR